MPRYSAKASVCERAAWAATSVTTVCFSLRLRLKVHSSHPMPSTVPLALTGARLRTPASLRFSDLLNGNGVLFQRDRHLRWLVAEPGRNPEPAVHYAATRAAPAVFDDLGSEAPMRSRRLPLLHRVPDVRGRRSSES